MDEQREREPSGVETRDSFYRKLTAALTRLARRDVLGLAQAKDVAQSVWQKFFRCQPDFAGDDARAQECGWLLRVARHEIADIFRAERRHPIQSLDALAEEPTDYREQESVNRENDEHELFHRWLGERRLKNPHNYRLLCGRHIEGTAVKTLAAETGLTVDQIYGRLHAEIRKFRTWLSRLPDEDLP